MREDEYKYYILNNLEEIQKVLKKIEEHERKKQLYIELISLIILFYSIAEAIRILPNLF